MRQSTRTFSKGVLPVFLSVGILLGVQGFLPASVLAAPTVGAPAVSPVVIPVGQATAISVTSRITSDPANPVIATGVNLLRVDASNKVLATLGTMRDDGTLGDAVAGDKTFTLVVNVNEAAEGEIRLRVSAAFKGLLKRVLSDVTGVPVQKLGPPEGVLLQGDPNGPAVEVTVDLSPVGVDEADIYGGVILTRLDLYLAPGATVGQINAALDSVNGGIVTMVRGLPTLTIAIPRPQDLNALNNVAQALRAAPGISWTAIAHVADPKVLPPSPASDPVPMSIELDHLFPTRFPAAWNASRLATNGCATRKVPVLVADSFQSLLMFGYANFPTEVPNFTSIGNPIPTNETHGYDVTTTLAASFDAANPTGANPFPDCLDILGVETDGLTPFQTNERIVQNFPAGKFLLNYSQGYGDRCDPSTNPAGCTPDQMPTVIDLPLNRAYHAGSWKNLTMARWDDFLIFVAAGNESNEPDTAIYPGLGVSVFDSPMSVATLADPFFGFAGDGSFWDPQPGFSQYPSLKADNADMLTLMANIQQAALGTVGPADNVLMVGSTTTGQTFDELAESLFSDSGPDLFAVGEDVYVFGETFSGFDSVNGTSFSTPQVTGLASYLWLLSDDLRNQQPSRVTRQAILDNARNVPGVGPVIDAYAAALSLDQAVLPTPTSAPVRLAILDVTDDDLFDEADLGSFQFIYTDSATGLPVEPTTPDYGRYDLNGDGFTGGSQHTERFDLDRISSTQYGQAVYDASVTQDIDGKSVSFDENNLTDTQILCYYAYSPLYTGDTAARTNVVGSLCGPKKQTIAVGLNHSCGIRTDGTVACWGSNTYGEATPPGGTFTQISAGAVHSCGIRTDGTVACWGLGVYTPPGGTFAQIAAGDLHACGILTDGTVACWGGYDYYGQATPPGGTFTWIAVGYDHSCGILTDGTVACWGRNYFGQTIPPGGTFTQIDAEGDHSCGIRTDGTVACWGYDDGYGTTTPPGGTFTWIDTGLHNSWGIRTDGTIAWWGGYDEDDPVPTPPGGTFTQIAAKNEHFCGIRTDGTVACWGMDCCGETAAPGGTFKLY